MSRPFRDPEERFWEKVRKPRRYVAECWEWLAYKHHIGHGTFWDGAKKVYAHRFAYEMLVGPIPTHLEIDHLCRNPGCVNPRHMEAVTHKTNVLRGNSLNAQNARRTECQRGHPFDEENTYFVQGGRRCRACVNDRQRRYREESVNG